MEEVEGVEVVYEEVEGGGRRVRFKVSRREEEGEEGGREGGGEREEGELKGGPLDSFFEAS